MKKRARAIIGIILTFCFVIIIFGTNNGSIFDNFIFTLILACEFIIYPFYHYIASLIEGVKGKDKEAIILAIIGFILDICVLTFFIIDIIDAGLSIGFIHVLYYLGFSMIMLIRSFRKAPTVREIDE